MQFLYDEQILKQIRNISKKKQLLQIAVAYWGKKAIEQTNLKARIEIDPSSVRIICDLESGSCNPYTIQRLIDAQVEVRKCTKMHAKIWICGNHVIIGSANASTNGLGFDDAKSLRNNKEAAAHIVDKVFARKARSWIDGLWEHSTTIDELDIELAKSRWQERKKIPYKDPIVRTTLLQAAKNTRLQGQFKNVRLVVWRETDEEISTESWDYVQHGARELYSDSEWKMSNRRGCYSWDYKPDWDFSRGNIYLDFTVPPNERKLKYNGIYRIVSPSGYFHRANSRSEERIVLYFVEKNVSSRVLTTDNVTEIHDLVLASLDRHDWVENESSFMLEENLVEFLNNKS